MDNIAEQNDVAKEISDAISTGLGLGSAVDDDDLLNELNDLEQEELDKDLLNVGPSTTKLPDVPSTDLPTTSKEKKKGMWRALQALLLSKFYIHNNIQLKYNTITSQLFSPILVCNFIG